MKAGVALGGLLVIGAVAWWVLGPVPVEGPPPTAASAERVFPGPGPVTSRAPERETEASVEARPATPVPTTPGHAKAAALRAAHLEQRLQSDEARTDPALRQRLREELERVRALGLDEP